MFVKFGAHWFRSYCRAVFAGDREVTRKHLPQAYRAVHEALCSPNLSQNDCKALREALRYLDMIEGVELKKASRGSGSQRLTRKAA